MGHGPWIMARTFQCRTWLLLDHFCPDQLKSKLSLFNGCLMVSLPYTSLLKKIDVRGSSSFPFLVIFWSNPLSFILTFSSSFFQVFSIKSIILTFLLCIHLFIYVMCCAFFSLTTAAIIDCIFFFFFFFFYFNIFFFFFFFFFFLSFFKSMR
jgi:hypothetical protein